MDRKPLPLDCIHYARKIVLASSVSLLVGGVFFSNEQKSQLAEVNTLNQDKDIHSAFEPSNESALPTNPFELINAIRRSNAMNDATSPTDAIDEALKGFDLPEESLGEEIVLQ